MIRIFGSSSALSPNVSINETYVAIVSNHFPNQKTELIAKPLATTNVLKDFTKNFQVEDSSLVNVLHFRADEFFILHENSNRTNFHQFLCNFYTTKKKYSKLGLIWLLRVLTQIYLLRFGILQTIVSKNNQLTNINKFLEEFEQLNCLSIVVIDSKTRLMTPLHVNIERKLRAKHLKCCIGKFTHAVYLDYADLGIENRHFQLDKLHLNTEGNEILAKGIIGLIDDKMNFLDYK